MSFVDIPTKCNADPNLIFFLDRFLRSASLTVFSFYEFFLNQMQSFSTARYSIVKSNILGMRLNDVFQTNYVSYETKVIDLVYEGQ